MKQTRKKFRFTYTQIIALSFLGVITAGAVLLCLPVSAVSGKTSLMDAVFTAASATCVTGLTVQSTAAHWTLFGKIVILCLIQIGGLGLMTLIAVVSLLVNRQLKLQGRRLLTQSAGSMQMGDIDQLLKRIIIGTFSFETAGAAVLAVRFCGRYGLGKGIWLAVFHAISAFCNAGFDILGETSFADYRSDALVNLTLMLLIVIGGLGFYVWTDIIHSRFRPSKLRLQSKLVLSVTGILLLGGTLIFFFSEKNHAMAGMSVGERMLASCFQSATLRTAGFFTVEQGQLSQTGVITSSVFMLIGGSPGSTAGGIKTVTVAVTLASALYAGRNVSDVTVFKRRIEEGTVKQAAAIAHVYVVAVLASTGLLCAIEPVRLDQALFEVASAIGTAGLSMGITAGLSTASKLLLTFLMYAGRIGGLTLVTVFAEKRKKVMLERPAEKIIIG
ncbi:MAG: Trk family potassium uptake protein [Clostridia bacterium]|nr:Trk family potassium uptake protein [Clostridia bacterium]